MKAYAIIDSDRYNVSIFRDKPTQLQLQDAECEIDDDCTIVEIDAEYATHEGQTFLRPTLGRQPA